MTTKTTLLSLAAGSAIAASMALAPLAHAGENPFAMKSLSASYLLADAGDKAKDGSCGGSKKADGSCGADKAAKTEKKMDGSCGDKKKEGACGDKKDMKPEAKVEKKKDGKCGEGKCGANKMKKTEEAK